MTTQEYNRQKGRAANKPLTTDELIELISINLAEQNTALTANTTGANAYADSKVEDAIVDGVTGKAPSQNAVYDALALKEGTANKDASGGYAGLTLLKINFKNALNTFTSFFTNSNTAARTYTFQDRNGTIADDTDITSAKARTNHTGTQTASTISDFNSAALSAAPAETASTVGALINGASAATPNDTDLVATAEGSVLKKITWTNVKAFLKTYFDTLYATASNTLTFTNKRITPRVLSAANYTTDTGTSLNCDTLDGFFVTAQAGALLFNNPSGTPTDGQVLLIRVKDDGTARALTYGSQFRGIGSTLPSTTVISKTLYLCAVWNATDSKWDTTNSQEV